MTFTFSEWLGFESHRRRVLLGDCEGAAVAARISHNAYISVVDHVDPPIADGELAGVPFAVKDNIDVAGMPTTGGSPLFALDVPDIDAGVVSTLREAGAVVVGKTNLHELAFGITSNNATYGPVRNPLDVSRVAGGSSGGSAAAVALGTVPFSLGTDTGGSVTIPSAFCGIVGFRPTTGRYPSDGVVNLSFSRDTIGIHARTVEDVRLVDRVITRTSPMIGMPDPADLVLGTVASRYDDMEPAVAEATHLALDDLRASGVKIVELCMPDDLTLAAEPGIELVFYEAERLLAARVNNGRGQTGPVDIADLTDAIGSPDVRAIFESIAATRVTASAYEQARRRRWQLRRLYEETFAAAGVHALIAPTVHVLPPHIGQDDTIDVNGRPQPVFPTVTRNSAPGSVAGVPMLSVPGRATAEGLSVGLCLEGRFFEDQQLLTVGDLVGNILHR
ncbi:amidase family protein [Rhodococcus sp. NPDC059968]|uniref:amidase family protein n=1 Tax=Rhodococcus sp. NPDC059968 TaxID=3347017 RepID=UPI003672A91A